MSRSMTARKRRSALRAAARVETAGVSNARTLDSTADGALGGATGGYALSERSTAWDAEGALARWREASGSAEAPSETYRDGFFWVDEDALDSLDSYRLPFVDIVDGAPVAVWRGVTATAGALQGARGGSGVPADDQGAVRAKVEAYYAKAREEFDDPAIRPPWEAKGAASVERIAFALAYADASTPAELLEREAFWLEGLPETTATWTTVTPNTTNSAAGATTTSTLYFGEATELLDAHRPRDERPRRRPGPPAPDVDANRTNAGQVRWEAVLAPEGKLTDDGRMFAPDSISWRELPLSLMVMTETAEGHSGAWLGGRLDRIWRDGANIRGSGVFTEDENGLRAAKLVADGALSGVSVDIAVREYEICAKDDLFDAEGALVWPQPVAAAEEEAGEPDLMDILFGGEEDEKPVLVVTDGVIGAVTVCPFPAFADANISLSASGLVWTSTAQAGFTLVREQVAEPQGSSEDAAEGLTASAAGMAPVVPPSEWFENPALEELTPLRVTEDGRVFGHAAGWDTCHIGIPDVCTQPPHSNTDYELFHLGAVRADTGDDVSIGKITLGTGHAPKHLDWRGAAAHYDNTGTVVADVVCGEDENGIWVAGALRPDVSAERVREFRAAALSGDWRSFDGNLELVALLAVNVPGFPIPRKRALVAAGDEGASVLTLVAAGVVTEASQQRAALPEGDMARLRQLAAQANSNEAYAELARLADQALGRFLGPPIKKKKKREKRENEGKADEDKEADE